MPNVSLDLQPGGKLEKRILTEVRDRVQFSKTETQKKHEKWKQAEERAIAYLPERDVDAARRLDRDNGGLPKYTTIQIPYSYAVLMASHTYWTTVFMGRDPVLQMAGRHGEGEQQVQAVEALMGYQTQIGGHLVPYYIWLLDVGKYGQGVLGNYWEKEEIQTSEILEVPDLVFGRIDTGKTKKARVTRRSTGYEGNRLYNVRPYDFFPDPRVPMYKFQEGEFCAVFQELGWNDIVKRADQGIYINIERLKPGETGGTAERDLGSGQIELPNTDSLAAFGILDKKASDTTKVYECHVELVPNKWGLGKSDYPEKWVFTVTADYRYVLGAQPLGALHNKFPFAVIEFEPEGYGVFKRGIPEILEPVQNTMDWLINSHFYNVRASLNNQFVVDPSRITMKDVLDPDPGNILRLKPSAYGSDPRLSIHQLEVKDITRSHLTDIQVMLDMGQRTLGVSDQILGMLNTKGRRSATEVRSSTTFGINRLKTAAEYFSAMGWGPNTQMMVQNSQQYYQDERKFKIVGDLALEAGESFMNVTPENIQGFFDLIPIDGSLPVDRLAQASLWKELMAGMTKLPALMEQYDISRIFAWVAQLSGLKNINQFRIEITQDEALDKAAQRGNAIPLGSAPGSANPGPKAPAPRQIANIGSVS